MQVGIVAEGKTDQAVLEQLVRGVVAERDGIAIAMMQPAQGAGDPEDFGNWENVFRWLSSERCARALQLVDLLVVHVDTDVCDRPGFDVPRLEGGRELEPLKLAARVAGRVRATMSPEVHTLYAHKVVIAVAVNEIECWLLPLIFDQAQAKASKWKGCFAAAMDELKRRGEPGLLAAKNGTKDPRRYGALARGFKKPAQLHAAASAQPSLAAFVDDLKVAVNRLLPPAA